MRKIILMFALLFCVFNVFAQEKRNSLYLELGGNAVFYSINYDHVFTLSKNLRLAPRVGFMYLPISDIVRTDFGDIRIPLEVNLLWSNKEKPKHFIEGGAGMNFIQITTNKLDPQSGAVVSSQNRFGKVTTLRLGYRYQKPTGGFMFRAGILMPVAQDEFSKNIMGDDIFFTAFPGISFGYSF